VASSAPSPTGTCLPCAGGSRAGCRLEVKSHQSGTQGQNALPGPAGHTTFDAAQDTVGLLGCKCTLSAHVQLFIHQYPQVLVSRAVLHAFFPSLY